MSSSSETTAWFFIADLSGYTALTETHGDEHAADVVTQYGLIVESVVDSPVRCIERVGDEALIVSPEAATAIQTAVRLLQAAEREPFFPAIRIGSASAATATISARSPAQKNSPRTRSGICPVADR